MRESARRASLALAAAVLLALLLAGCGQSVQDAVAPEIADITTQDLTATSVVIAWTTNEPATSRVDHGLTDQYGRSTTTGSGRAVSHEVGLMGLVPATTYHYRVYSEDAAGNGTFSADRTFGTPDIDAPLITGVAAGAITGVGATITWTTSEPATSQVDYGLTDQYGQATAVNTNLVTSHSVSLTGLTAGSTYHYRVRSKDALNHEGFSDDHTFTTSSAGYLVISPATASITAGSTRAYTAEAFDQFNNSLGDVTSATAFSIQSGAGGSWARNVYTSQVPGTWTVTGTYTGLAGTATLTVGAGSVASIVISPASSAIIAGNTQAYTAEAFDRLSNSLGDVTTGTIFSMDAAAGGSWVANVYTSRKAGTWTVTGSYAGRTDTASLTVTKAAAGSIVISPAVGTVIAGNIQAYTAEAFDQFQNSLGDVTAGTGFSIQPAAGGSWLANVYASQKKGTWTVTGSYQSFTATATLTVAAATPFSIVVSPDNVSVVAGSGQAYTVEAFDQFNNSLGDVTTSTLFSILQPGHGGTWSANVYTSRKVGTWTVRATYAVINDDTLLTVTAGAATRLDLTPDGGVATPGVAFNVTVTAYDAYDNVATGYTGTVTFASTDGSATLPGPFTFTPSDGGTHTFSVTLVMPSLSSTVEVTDGTLADSASWMVA
ncbi:MAG: hypothetical protein FJ020_03260 [Chloroflexi bacterium]|nr:hypothetical protein [Chloroflexota bacterium]